jgi:acyl dehydratase
MIRQLRPESASDLRALVGSVLGPTEWYVVDQDGVDRFAEATGDRQWIHVDPLRAAASPLGGTIVHGLFTLGLGPRFLEELISFDGFAHSLNYGYGKVRFPAPFRVGARVRMRLSVDAVDEVPGGVQLTSTQTFELEGADKPVCVAESLGRFVERSAIDAG